MPLPLVTVALIPERCFVGDGIKLDAVAGCGSCMTLDMLLLELPEGICHCACAGADCVDIW